MRRICRWLICATIAPSDLASQRQKRQIQPVALREKAVGAVLREFRERSGLSQESLSSECGFDRTYVSRVERGIINPTIGRLWRISDALQAPLSEIVKAMEGWAAKTRE
jgi:ribosome-binding protein aMBF1 (putative translation factor)